MGQLNKSFSANFKQRSTIVLVKERKKFFSKFWAVKASPSPFSLVAHLALLSRVKYTKLPLLVIGLRIHQIWLSPYILFYSVNYNLVWDCFYFGDVFWGAFSYNHIARNQISHRTGYIINKKPIINETARSLFSKKNKI